MEKKINIAELLKDCPKGMELDCILFNNPVKYDGFDNDDIYPIAILTETDDYLYVTKEGCLYNIPNSKCIIYPKGKTTWEGFVPPCKFKDGDILVHSQNQRFIMSIYHKAITELVIKTHCILWDKEEGLSVNKQICCYADSTRLATEEEKEKLFQAIKDNGYKWNSETKTLGRLIVPKFKVGDVIQDIDLYKVKITEVNIEDECYGYESVISKGIGGIGFNEQDNWELAPNKFDINTLKPFDKVLTRANDNDSWVCNLYSHRMKDYYVVLNAELAKQCIPYEGNEHLLNTANDCDSYYKNWEE